MVSVHFPNACPKKADKTNGQDTELSEQPGEEDIPFNLDNLRRHLAEVTLARRVLPEDVSARQKLLEESVYDVAVARLKYEANLFADLGLQNNALHVPDLKQWMWDWHTKLKARLEKELKNIVAAEKEKRGQISLSPFLALVKPERLSLITILEIMRLQGSGGVFDGMKTTRALVAVGKAVELEYKAQMCRTNKIHIPSTAVSKQGDAGASFFSNMGYRNLQERRVAAAKHTMDGEAWTAAWTQVVRSKVGGILVDCLMDVAEVTRTAEDKKTGKLMLVSFIFQGTLLMSLYDSSEVQPAFYHSYEYMRGQKLGTIRLNPVVSERLAKDELRETLHPRHLPMLIKPKPWLNHDEGGYLYNKSNCLIFLLSLHLTLTRVPQPPPCGTKIPWNSRPTSSKRRRMGPWSLSTRAWTC